MEVSPKELFLGKMGMQTACSLAVCCFNDGASSLATLRNRLQLEPTPLLKVALKRKDRKRLAESQYKASEGAKNYQDAHEGRGRGWMTCARVF